MAPTSSAPRTEDICPSPVQREKVPGRADEGTASPLEHRLFRPGFAEPPSPASREKDKSLPARQTDLQADQKPREVVRRGVDERLLGAEAFPGLAIVFGAGRR